MCCIELVRRANNFAYKTFKYDSITELSVASDEQVLSCLWRRNNNDVLTFEMYEKYRFLLNHVRSKTCSPSPSSYFVLSISKSISLGISMLAIQGKLKVTECLKVFTENKTNANIACVKCDSLPNTHGLKGSRHVVENSAR